MDLCKRPVECKGMCATHYHQNRRRLADPKRDSEKLKNMARTAPARCKCGLMLPCNNCLPTIYQMATKRDGNAQGI